MQDFSIPFERQLSASPQNTDISFMENEEAIDHLNFIYRCQLFIIVRLRNELKIDTQVYWETVTKIHWPENRVTYKATPTYVEISAAQALAINKHASAKGKHMNLKYHHFEAAFSGGIILLRGVPSKDNPIN